MSDPFRNPLASARARVEVLERENQELRAKLSATNSRRETRDLRQGRASWLLTGLLASFFPLVAAPLFFSAPKAPWLARRSRLVQLDVADATRARAGEVGERPGAFPGVALRGAGEREREPERAALHGAGERERAVDEAALRARVERERPRPTVGFYDPPRPAHLGSFRCTKGDPLCNEPEPSSPRPPSKGAELDLVDPWSDTKAPPSGTNDR